MRRTRSITPGLLPRQGASLRCARANGSRFLDLTDPSRQEVQARQVWLYGRHDKGHWSPQGTAIMADVLSRELRTVIGQGAHTKMGSSAQDADDPQQKSRPLKR